MFCLLLVGYNIGPNSTLTIPNYVEYLHQFLEASKFAFAERAHLGDPDFVKDMYKVSMTSHTLSGKSLSGESVEFTKILPDKVSPNKINMICLNDLLPS